MGTEEKGDQREEEPGRRWVLEPREERLQNQNGNQLSNVTETSTKLRKF